LANVKQIFSSEIFGQIKPNFAGSIYVISSIKLHHLVLLTVANQKNELLLLAMFVGQMEPYEEAL
jgi:hypothetical protein